MSIIDRLFKNWKTTVIGAVIVIGPVVSHFIYPEQVTWAGIASFWGVVLMLFFGGSKDK